MNNNDFESEQADAELQKYTVAEGIDGLNHALETILEKSKNDPTFATQNHYILYQLGAQKSLIKVDFSKEPYMFYYKDLLGRPITQGVKNAILNFLWEKCGVKETYNNRVLEEFK